MLDDSQRKQLDDIVVKMAQQGAPKEAVHSVVNDFKSKYDSPENSNLLATTNDVAPAQSPMVDEKPSFGESYVSGLKDMAQPTVGAAKGIASTISGLSSVGERTMKGLGRILTPKAYEEKLGFAAPEQTAGEKAQEYLKPTNLGQKVGFGTEQIAEFLIPGAVIGNSAKVASKAPLISKAIPFASNLAKNTLGSAAVAASQAGDVKDDSVAQSAGWTFAFGMASPAVSGVLNKAGNALFAAKVPTTITQRAKDMANKLDLGGAVSSIGPTLTQKSMATKLTKETGKWGKILGDKIDDFVNANPNLSYTMKELTKNLKDDVFNNPSTMAKLGATPIDLPKVSSVIDDVIGKYKSLYRGQRLNISDIQKLKVALGDGLEAAFKKAPTAIIGAKPLTEMKFRTSLKKVIETHIPEAQAINSKLAPLFTASGRLASKGQYSGYLTDMIVGSAYAAKTSGNPLTDPVDFTLNFIKGALLKRGLTSTAVMTTTGTTFKKLAEALKSPATAQALRMLFNSFDPEEDKQAKVNSSPIIPRANIAKQ